MEDTAKYLIHADVATDGVVERSDVVGAVFGQTEGLLGDELDIRDLQQSSKLGRIDVAIESEGGQSFGQLTIASNLDRVETAVLAAGLETIDRVGPCEATIRVTEIQDARSAKRRAVVDRAKELLATAFEDTLTTEELVAEVRESVRVEDIVEYEGYPAGPRVGAGDAVIVVEGRADVLRLLRYGVKNAVAVEGVNVPDPIADLTRERTATAFLDGDHGGDLILRELAQVGDIDYVARAPDGRSVEDLSREAVLHALREKVPLDVALDRLDEEEGEAEASEASEANEASEASEAAETNGTVEADSESGGTAVIATPQTLPAHATAVCEDGTGTVRLLASDCSVLEEADADDAVAAVEAVEEVPHAVVVDGVVTQALLDVAAQRGVERVVGRERGDFTKQPASVRVHTAAELQ
ncbi:MAG: DNA primase DnaG [Halobacteriaceae archaeon]